MNNTRGPALARAAEAMLRALGGSEIKLRCPVGAAANAQARELGLDAPAVEDISVAQVVVRGCPTAGVPVAQRFSARRGDSLTGVGRVGSGVEEIELLIAPSSVAQFMHDRGQTAEQFFNAVVAVLHGGREWQLKLFHVEQFAGAAYLYRLTLAAKS